MKTYEYSSLFRKLLWTAIFVLFVIVHTPKDKIEFICKYGIDVVYEKSESIKGVIGNKESAVWGFTKFAVRLKKIAFLISMVILLIPIIDSLKKS